MPRIPALNDDAASPAAKEIFTAIRAKIGMVPNLYRTTAHQPAVLSALLGLGEALGKGGFDARTREAIALAVAGANACDYCASAHSAISKGMKIDTGEIAHNLRGRSGDPKTAAILALAVAINAKRGNITDADLTLARSAGLTDGEIVETVAAVVANIFTNYLNHVFGTEIDFPAIKAAA
ncbi:MAG: peroxidase-related enzyme [Rhodobacteraceae bacterium]|nr:peroxidase-related enzyme [Paracoccaceae bacterium]